MLAPDPALPVRSAVIVEPFESRCVAALKHRIQHLLQYRRWRQVGLSMPFRDGADRDTELFGEALVRQPHRRAQCGGTGPGPVINNSHG